MEFILFILIGVAMGWLAGGIWKGRGFGITGYILAGVVGALIGGGLFRSMSAFVGGGLFVNLLMAIVGSAFLIAILRIFRRP